MIGVIAAVAVPAYDDYTARAKLTLGYIESEPARRAIAAYYAEKKEMPPSLDEVGVAPTLGSGRQLSLEPDSQALTVDTAAGQLVFLPQQETEGGPIVWQCAAGDGVKAAQLPRACREPAVAPTQPPWPRLRTGAQPGVDLLQALASDRRAVADHRGSGLSPAGAIRRRSGPEQRHRAGRERRVERLGREAGKKPRTDHGHALDRVGMGDREVERPVGMLLGDRGQHLRAVGRAGLVAQRELERAPGKRFVFGARQRAVEPVLRKRALFGRGLGAHRVPGGGVGVGGDDREQRRRSAGG